MSACYRVTGESFDRAAWRKEVVGELEDKEAGWNPLPHPGGLTEHEDWMLLVDGSISGVGVSPFDEGGQQGDEVRVHPMGSVRDWELAHRVLEMALEGGADVRDEGGAEAGAEKFSREAAAWAFGGSFKEDRAALGEAGEIGCGLFSLVVMEDELELGDEALAKALAGRVRRLGRAHPATLMVLTSEDKRHEISAANYGQISTLIPAGATHITFGALGGDVIEGVVSVDDFKEILGELVEPAGEYWYVPAVDFSAEPVFLKSLRERATLADEALKEAPKPVPHPDEKPISPAQWELLETGPALVFLAVAASDGRVSKRETTTFAKVIVGAAHLEAECPSLGRALGASLEKVPKVIAEIEAATDFDAAAEVRRIGEAVDACLSEDEATNYKLGLLFIGKEVAEASGGFFGLGRRINAREAAALKMVSEALGVGVEG